MLEALGYDVSGEVTVEPKDLRELRARVVLETEEWEDPVTGRRQQRMRVPYQGYRPASAEANGDPEGAGEASAGADDPFDEFRP